LGGELRFVGGVPSGELIGITKVSFLVKIPVLGNRTTGDGIKVIFGSI
jgi:hypothetical protein